MSAGMAVTFFTLGLSIAILIASVFLGLAIWLSPSFYEAAAIILSPDLGLDEMWLGGIIAIGGGLLAFGLFRFQQAVALMLVRRHMGRLRHEYSQIEQERGTAAADAFLKSEATRIGTHVIGEREPEK